MKYRRLSDEEFKHYEKQFKEFLDAKEISDAEWNNIRETNTVKKENLIDEFSDSMIEQILQVVTLLEHRTNDMIRYFTLDQDNVNMVGLRVEGNDLIDFREENSSDGLNEKLNEGGGELKLIAAEKEHEGNTLQEKFNLLEKGCTICQDPSLFQSLKQQVDQHKQNSDSEE